PLPPGSPPPRNDRPNDRDQSHQRKSYIPLLSLRAGSYPGSPPRICHLHPLPMSPPQNQLGLELQSHIAAAVASRTAQIKTTGDEVLELVSMVSQKVINWEKQSLQGAASLGRDFQN